MNNSGRTQGPKAFIIAGTRSGVGKTTLTLGIMEAFRRRGLKVQPFKAGPDYIDPGFHTALCRNPSYNLDTWMMGTRGVKKTFSRAMESKDVGVVEGVMGLFDGKYGVKAGGEGSTAHIARVLGLPVILVLDSAGISGSAGAVVKGFEGFDRGVKITGVIFNRVASPRHFEMLTSAVTENTKARILGFLPADEKIKLPHRHLGLVTSGDLTGGEWGRFLKKAHTLVEKNIDINGLLKVLPIVRLKRVSSFKSKHKNPCTPYPHCPPCPKIAVARDTAFCFYYRENLDILESLGAKVVFFSPLKDKRLPKGVKGIYLGGGYPELYAERLAANWPVREEIKRFAQAGYPVYAECGGLMYLGRALKDLKGRTHKMAGVFPWTSRMLERRKALGYSEVKAKAGCPFLKRGAAIRGHEYHYSEITRPPSGIERVFELSGSGATGTGGLEGYLYKNTLASYVHLHFASNRSFAEGFVKACGDF
jgi:cobyrinic acid a,c-diamide synthase